MIDEIGPSGGCRKRVAEGIRPCLLWIAASTLLTLASSPALACNEGDKLTDYMQDWLASSDEARATIVDEYDADIKKGGFQIDGLKSKYVAFFGKRTKPIDELKRCGDDGVIDALGAAIKRTNQTESAN